VQQGLCNDVVSVHLCPSYRLLQQHAAGVLMCVQWAGDINRLLNGWRGSSKGEQCHVYSHRRRLNTDLVLMFVTHCSNAVTEFAVLKDVPNTDGYCCVQVAESR